MKTIQIRDLCNEKFSVERLASFLRDAILRYGVFWRNYMDILRNLQSKNYKHEFLLPGLGFVCKIYSNTEVFNMEMANLVGEV